MQNKDARNAALNQFRQDFRTGPENKDFDQVASALQVYADRLVNNLTDAAQEFQKTSDEAILARAGVRPVPSEVKAWYDGIVKAFSAEEPRQALTGVDKTIPEFVIDTVLSDINNNHPLLAALDVVNTRGNTKYTIAKDKHQLAQWGKLTAAITKELEGTIEEGHFGQDKLTAFLPVPKDLLKLGASYINAYIVKILSDALACGLEFGAIKGTGKDMPIGAVKNLDGAVVQGEYPDKEAIPVASFDIKTFMTLVAMLAEKPKYAGEAKGRPRKVTKVALIVNPTDYLTKVIPATTVLATDGSYKNNVFPFPTEVFPTEELDEGEALFGIMEDGKIKYKLFLSTGIGGNIEYSDDYQFLEDNRVYAIKLLGTGRPDDNNCFIKLDISALDRNIVIAVFDRQRDIVEEVDLWRADKAGNEDVIWMIEYFLRGTDLLDKAVVHDDDPVAQSHGFDLVMSNVYECRIDLLTQSDDLGSHLATQLGIKVG